MPLISVIVPCYNEQATIGLLLDALYQQDCPLQEMEVIIADGLSTDNTRKTITDFQLNHPDLSIINIDNPKRIIPAALNCAIAASQGEYILRLDAHSMPHPDYVSKCVKALQDGRGENVGGIWEIKPARTGWVARSIAAAAAHPLGAGDALYRHTRTSQYVDSVPFGAFHRSLIDRIGRFDESLPTNEDYEFNVRVRRSGGRVWLDAAIRSVYFARPSLKALARQYWRYGYWKARMLIKYPSTLRWRQALPPIFILSLLGLSFLSFLFPIASWLLALELVIYCVVLLAASGVMAIRQRDPALLLGIVIAIAIMHLSWGAAFIWSLLSHPVTWLRRNSLTP